MACEGVLEASTDEAAGGWPHGRACEMLDEMRHAVEAD